MGVVSIDEITAETLFDVAFSFLAAALRADRMRFSWISCWLRAGPIRLVTLAIETVAWLSVCIQHVA